MLHNINICLYEDIEKSCKFLDKYIFLSIFNIKFITICKFEICVDVSHKLLSK